MGWATKSASTAIDTDVGSLGESPCEIEGGSVVSRLLLDPMLRKGFLSVLDQAVVSGTNFITAVVIARMCSQSELGIYYLALSLVFFIRGIQEQVISAPFSVYSHRRSGERLASFSGSVLVHQLVLSAVAVFALAGFVGLLSTGTGPLSLRPTAIVLLVVVPVSLLREFIRHLAIARFQLRTAVVLDVTVAVLQLTGLAWLARTQGLTIPLVYGVIGIASALAVLGWFVAQHGSLRFERRRVASDWRHNWGFGRWALASQLVGSTTPYILPWILAVSRGEAETGVLAACVSLVGLANMFVIGFSNFLSPKAANAFASGGVAELRRVLRKTVGIFGVTLGGFCVAVLIDGDGLAQWIFGSDYAGSGPAVVILALGMLANSMSITAGNGLWAMDRPELNFSADVAVLVASVFVALWMIPSFGVIGAAVAMLSAGLIGAAIRFTVLGRLMASHTGRR